MASEPPEEEEGNSGSEPERSAESATELGTYGIERGAESAMELSTYGELERGAESAMGLGMYGKRASERASERRRRAERGAESPMVLGTHGRLGRGAESAMERGTYGIERGAESAMELGTNEMANESPCRGGISCTATENPRAEVRC